jgi:hypothetical protein
MIRRGAAGGQSTGFPLRSGPRKRHNGAGARDRRQLAEYSSGFCAMWQDKRDGNIDLYLRNSLLPECPADFDGDGDVDTADLLHLLAAWGTPDGDVDGDGDTDTADLLALLAAWGPCP